jgi:phospholipid/cholesterol/gamma-HCH transport system permease protein
MIIALIGSYKGLTTQNGAKGVGLSTTVSVVSSSVAILVVDYLVAQFLL